MRGASTLGTLMLIGMGVTNSKLSEGGRKLKKKKHYVISKTLNINEKRRAYGMRIESGQQKCHNEKCAN